MMVTSVTTVLWSELQSIYLIVYYEQSLQAQVHYYATRACDRPQCAGTWKCTRMCAHVSCGLAPTLRRARAHMTSTSPPDQASP